MFVREIGLGENRKEYPIMSSYTIDDEINGNVVMSMVVEPNKPNIQFIKELSEFWEIVTNDGEVYKIVYCQSAGNGNSLTKKIKAIPKFYDEFNNSRIYPAYSGSYAVDELFRIVFKDTDYTFFAQGVWKNIEIENYGDGETRLEMFKRVLKRIGAEFEVSFQSVTIREKIGNETNIMYRHKLNASNIVREIDAQNYWTYAKGFADYENETEGQKSWTDAKLKRDYTSPLAKILGIREAPPVKDGRMNSITTLDAALKSLVDNSIQISVSANLLDLSKQNYPFAQSNLGDTAFLIDERIGLNETVRVVKRSIDRNWKGEITDLKFTFGSQGMVERYQGKVNDVTNAINEILDGRKKLPFAAMSNEIQILNKLMINVQTQLKVTENGSLAAIDKFNPNLVVIFNSNGLFVSDDGGKTAKAAITGRGIMGDRIIANSITADKLDVNAITVGFNNASSNVKLFGHTIDFYSNNQKTAAVNGSGMEFFYGSRYIGSMGQLGKKNNSNVRGINLALSNEGDYLSFSHRPSSNSDYIVMITMDPYGRMTGWKGVNISMPVRAVDKNNYSHELSDALNVGTSFKGKNLAIPTSIAGDGTANEWYNFKF